MGTSNREPYSQPEDEMLRFIAEVNYTKGGIEKKLAEYENHDCKLSPDSGCEVCEKIFELKESLRELNSLVAQVNKANNKENNGEGLSPKS
jgi:hypothetical protein